MKIPYHKVTNNKNKLLIYVASVMGILGGIFVIIQIIRVIILFLS